MEQTKFLLGDQVKVVNYGHWRIDYDENKGWSKVDTSKGIIGKVGIISEVSLIQDIAYYAIEGISGKHAWYQDNQLELVYRPSYEGGPENKP